MIVIYDTTPLTSLLKINWIDLLLLDEAKNKN